MLVDYSGQRKKINAEFLSGCLLSRALDDSSRTKMNYIFKSCQLGSSPLGSRSQEHQTRFIRLQLVIFTVNVIATSNFSN